MQHQTYTFSKFRNCNGYLLATFPFFAPAFFALLLAENKWKLQHVTVLQDTQSIHFTEYYEFESIAFLVNHLPQGMLIIRVLDGGYCVSFFDWGSIMNL